MPDNVIRRVTVLTDFKTGTVDIAPPELGGSLEAKEKDVDLTNELNEATEALAATTGEWTTDYSDQLAGLADQLAALASQQAEGSADTQQAISAVVMAIRNQADATKDGAEAADASTKQQIKGTRDVAEGIFRIVRATALLTGVNDESMQSLVKNLALVQGAFDIYKGGSNLIQGLQTMNPLLLGVGAAVGAAATAWNAYADAKERARKEDEDHRKALQDIRDLVTPNLSPELQAQRAREDYDRATGALRDKVAAVNERTGVGELTTVPTPYGGTTVMIGGVRTATEEREILELQKQATAAKKELLAAEEVLRQKQKADYEERIRDLKENDPFKGLKAVGLDPDVLELQDKIKKLEEQSKRATEAGEKAFLAWERVMQETEQRANDFVTGDKVNRR